MNKSDFRRVTVLIVISLAALAGLQVYWVVRMYADMNRRFAEKVTAAMERAAYDELVTRNRNDAEVFSDLIQIEDIESIAVHKLSPEVSGIVFSVKSDSAGQEKMDTLKNRASSNNALTVVGVGTRKRRAQSSSSNSNATNLTIYRDGTADRRISIIDIYSTDSNLNPKDFARYDSLLNANLLRVDITLPYRLSIVETDSGKELSFRGEAVEKFLSFDIPIGSEKASTLRLQIENPNREFRREMAGLIVSSALTVLLLALAFVYLLRTLFRQKTLEEMRRDFTHNITHELKTPIAVAYAANDALLNYHADADPDRRKKYLGIGQSQLETLSMMVERILTLSFEEKGDFSLDRSRIELRPALEKLAETYRIKSRKPVEFSVSVEPESHVVYADPFQLNIALGNLIDNALKYSGEAVEIGLSARRIPGGVEIRVSDTGIGIAPAVRERIFEKFYRVPTGNIHDVKGSGLGLYYVHQIVERHGGTVSVVSRPGKGTAFTLQFPDDGTEN